VAEFLLELYVSRLDGTTVEAGAERARRAAEDLCNEGRPVRYLRSLFVPDEETCFYIYEADSADDVREAARRADLPAQNVVGAITRSN
jgi:hypothetical protein